MDKNQSIDSMALFNKNQKLADVLNINPQLILMLPRFDIALGFGEKTIGEICEENNLPSDLFVMLCNVYTFDDYLPSEEEIKQMDGSALVKYLKASHDYYLHQRLTHIGKHLERIAEQAGNIQAVLIKFFRDYKSEVKRHFVSEEKNVFPFILNDKDSAKISSYLSHAEKTHVDINTKLAELTNIIIKYLSPDILPNERISVWFDIAQLSKDLAKHAIIEEKILIPYLEFIGKEDRHD